MTHLITNFKREAQKLPIFGWFYVTAT